MMLHRRRLAPLLLALLCLPLQLTAQQHQTAGNLQVYVTYPDDRAVSEQLKVELISGSSGTQVGEAYTDDRGRAHFSNLPAGTYQLSVSGQSIQATVSDMFDVEPRRGNQSLFVRVKPAGGNGGVNGPNAGSSPVSASDLKVPEEASREFDKATELIAKQQWQKAIERLNRALALYPAYAQAYTNLGVVYARLGEPDKEREALQKAIAANDHFAPAFVNLARMEVKERNYPAAEAHLNQATAADPTDVGTLALLAQVQLLDRHYEDAIANARKVHAMPHDSYALVHYVAARACERLNRLADAIVEFKLFLSEEPSGVRSSAARQEMGAVQKQSVAGEMNGR
jgi:tetratricopeptide (TPR) repeat protein